MNLNLFHITYMYYQRIYYIKNREDADLGKTFPLTYWKT